MMNGQLKRINELYYGELKQGGLEHIVSWHYKISLL
jgi:hypothetical protein